MRRRRFWTRHGGRPGLHRRSMILALVRTSLSVRAQARPAPLHPSHRNSKTRSVQRRSVRWTLRRRRRGSRLGFFVGVVGRAHSFFYCLVSATRSACRARKSSPRAPTAVSRLRIAVRRGRQRTEWGDAARFRVARWDRPSHAGHTLAGPATVARNEWLSRVPASSSVTSVAARSS